MTAANYVFPNAESIHRETFKNGLTVLIYENPTTESVVISGTVLAGSLYEMPQKNGLASMTASALMRGTAAHDADSLNSQLEDIGASLSFSGGRFRVGFNGRALAEDAPVLFSVLSEALQQPTFPDDEIDQLRTKSLTGLNHARQDTRYRAAKSFREALYPPTHPYHFAAFGTPETISQIDADDLRNFHARVYGADDAILTIVGAVDTAQTLDTLHTLFDNWHNPQKPDEPALPVAPPPQTMTHRRVEIAGKTQSDIMMGTVGPSRYAPDYTAASLANSILGEFGMMGRIGNVIREELGLAYYAYSRMESGQGPGAWHVTMGVAPENVALAAERAQAELRRITTEPVSDDELSDNQSYFTGRLPLRLESNSGIASIIHSMERYGLGMDYLTTYRDLIYSVTTDDILAAAQAYINPDALVISVAGPAQDTSDEL